MTWASALPAVQDDVPFGDAADFQPALQHIGALDHHLLVRAQLEQVARPGHEFNVVNRA